MTRNAPHQGDAMRSLTLTQPWAGLVASGIKLVENRPRHMIKRDAIGRRFAIHASREIDGSVFERIWEIAPELRRDPPVAWFKLAQRTSAVIAVATLDQILDPVAHGIDTAEPAASAPLADDQRRWFFGPIGYVLRDVRTLATPVPCRGSLGFWTLPPHVERAVVAQIGGSP